MTASPTSYNNDNCILCSLWQNASWDVQNCISDLGLGSPLDPFTFLLKVYWPTALAFIQSPSNFPWPFDLLIASSTYQGWVHRFDNFNSGPDANPVDYSQMFTCNIGVLLIPTLIFLYTLGALLLFDPVQSLLWAAILIFCWVLGPSPPPASSL
jgi:hypothetical protein